MVPASRQQYRDDPDLYQPVYGGLPVFSRATAPQFIGEIRSARIPFWITIPARPTDSAPSMMVRRWSIPVRRSQAAPRSRRRNISVMITVKGLPIPSELRYQDQEDDARWRSPKALPGTPAVSFLPPLWLLSLMVTSDGILFFALKALDLQLQLFVHGANHRRVGSLPGQ